MREVTSQMKQLDEILSVYESLVKSKEETFWNDMESHGINEEVLKKIHDTWKTTDLGEVLDLTSMDTLFEESNTTTEKLKEEYYYAKDKSIPYFDYCIQILTDAREEYESLLEVRENLQKTSTEKENLLKNFVETIKSPEYRQARLKQINEMKERANSSDISEDERRTLINKLNIIEKSQNLTFLTDRLHKLGNKEKKSIQTAYFDTNRGNYIMERYQNVLKHLGVNPNIHAAFFDIEEENFRELYREYNNFFLFHIVRFIAYADINNDTDYLYISAILGVMRNIAMNKSTDEEKTMFLSIIKEFYSFFDTDENKEYFKLHNHAYKFHPERIKMEKQMAIARREEEKKNIKMELGTLFTGEIIECLSHDTFDTKRYLEDIISTKLKMMEALKNYQDECNASKKDCFFDMKDIHTYEEAYLHFKEIKRIQNEESENKEENADETETGTGLENTTKPEATQSENLKKYESKNTEETTDELQ